MGKYFDRIFKVPGYDDPQEKIAAKFGISFSIIAIFIMIPYTILNIYLQDTIRVIIGISFLSLVIFAYIGTKNNLNNIVTSILIISIWLTTVFTIFFTSEGYSGNFPVFAMVIVLSFVLKRRSVGVLFTLLTIFILLLRTVLAIYEINTPNLIEITDYTVTISTLIMIIVIGSILNLNSSILNNEIKTSKQLLVELSKSEEKYKQLVELSPYGIIETDIQGNISYLNPSYMKLHGYDQTHLDVPKNILEFQRTQGGQDRLKGYLNHVKNNKPESTPYMSQLIHPSGKEVTLKIDWDYKDRSKCGDELEFISMVTDVTDMLRIEKENQKALVEKEILLKEVHHRVKNNLMIISSFIQLQVHNQDDSKSKAILLKTLTRIKAISSIYSQIHNSDDFTSLNLDQNINDLINLISEVHDLATKKISFNIDVQKIILPLDTIIPINLLINELITNSLKHAFPETQKGVINIIIKEIEKSISIILSDNGIGYDPKTIPSKSLGTQIVESLVRQVNGSMEISSDNGTKISIQIPLKIRDH